MKNKQQLSIDEEMLMWTSYRYCIGRKSYVCSLAPYIGKKYYPLLSDERAQFAANDIRNCICDILRFNHPCFKYEGSVGNEERYPMADYIAWLNENVNCSNDLYNIESITCYKDGYGEKYDKKYDVCKKTRPYEHVFDSDIDNLLVWETLASLFDKKNHKMITVNYDNEIKDIECFPVIVKKHKPVEENPMFCARVPWRWETVWMSIDGYITRGDRAGYLNEDFIVEIKDM